jgi:hypothetical protein
VLRQTFCELAHYTYLGDGPRFAECVVANVTFMAQTAFQGFLGFSYNQCLYLSETVKIWIPLLKQYIQVQDMTNFVFNKAQFQQGSIASS